MPNPDSIDSINETLNSLLLRKQLSPHFINNTLNAIQNLSIENNKEQAIKYISLFSKYLNLIYEYSGVDLISLEQEVNFIEIYLELQKLRFKSKLEIFIQIDPLIKNDDFKKNVCIPFVTKAFIENSIEHGIFHVNHVGELRITFRKENINYSITIEDNGIGIEESKLLNKWKDIDYSKNSLAIIKERYKQNIQIIEIDHNSNSSKGTKIVLIL